LCFLYLQPCKSALPKKTAPWGAVKGLAGAGIT